MASSTSSTGMTPTFIRNNKIRTIVGNLFVFASGEEERYWLTREECRLLYEFLTKHRGFFGLPEVNNEQN